MSSKRKNNDPDAPRPYRTAYLHFANDRRQEIIRVHPEMDSQQVSKELGRLWKTVPDVERRPWYEVAGYDRARYEAEVKNYNNPILREAELYNDDVRAYLNIYISEYIPSAAF